jgi:hypothetical protein
MVPQQGRCSFLKKRTKKLLSVSPDVQSGAHNLPDGLAAPATDPAAKPAPGCG